jgi:CBS domain-containing protein
LPSNVTPVARSTTPPVNATEAANYVLLARIVQPANAEIRETRCAACPAEEREFMAFQEDLLDDKIKSLALRDAIAIDQHTLLRAAIAMMRSHALGCAVIVDQHRHPIGIFTEQSIIRVLVAGVSLDSTPVSDFTDPDFAVVGVDEPIQSAWRAVVDRGIRFLCVTDADGRLVGLSGERGLAEYVCDCFAEQITVQRLGSAPWMLQREGA